MNRIACLIVSLGMIASVHAQLEVGVEKKRTTFMRGEPVELTVTIRNLTGKDIILRDVERHQWFGFEVIRGSDTPVAPYASGYKNDILSILAGDTVRRKVDLARLFSLAEFGTYKIRPAIYFDELGKYFSSEPTRLEITDGRKLWSRTVGVPPSKEGAGEYRVASLLVFQQPKEQSLYVRIEDSATGDSLGTYPLGRYLGGTTPTTEFDNDNTLYVFHLVGTGQYYLSKIGVNGEWLGQTSWSSAKGRAIVRRKTDGTLVVVGATREVAAVGGPPVPKLSDRPVPLPVPPPR